MKKETRGDAMALVFSVSHGLIFPECFVGIRKFGIGFRNFQIFVFQFLDKSFFRRYNSGNII